MMYENITFHTVESIESEIRASWVMDEVIQRFWKEHTITASPVRFASDAMDAIVTLDAYGFGFVAPGGIVYYHTTAQGAQGEAVEWLEKHHSDCRSVLLYSVAQGLDGKYIGQTRWVEWTA